MRFFLRVQARIIPQVSALFFRYQAKTVSLFDENGAKTPQNGTLHADKKYLNFKPCSFLQMMWIYLNSKTCSFLQMMWILVYSIRTIRKNIGQGASFRAIGPELSPFLMKMARK